MRFDMETGNTGGMDMPIDINSDLGIPTTTGIGLLSGSLNFILR